MSPIGKTFTHHDEVFVVSIKGHDHYIRVSLRDKRSWRFSFDELRHLISEGE